jgi:hypothetical protein
VDLQAKCQQFTESVSAKWTLGKIRQSQMQKQKYRSFKAYPYRKKTMLKTTISGK